MKGKCVGMVRLNMADRALIDKQRLIDEWEYILDEQEVDICDASFIASVLVDDLIQNAPVVERRKHGEVGRIWTCRMARVQRMPQLLC